MSDSDRAGRTATAALVPDRERASSAIYGTILVTAVIVALSEDPNASARELAEAVATTTVVFWLAHAYSDYIGRRAATRDPARWETIRLALARDVAGHTQSLPALVEQMSALAAQMTELAEATEVLRPMDGRMANIEGAMPVLVEVQQHLALVPDILERLDTGITRMSDTLDRLLVALDELDADVSSLGTAVSPLGRLAQRMPGRGRRGDRDSESDQ